MGDFGIKISTAGADASTAAAAQLLLDTRRPFHKLDVTNPVSFRELSITFIKDPPNPSGSGGDLNRTTLIYSFPHGYTYVPTTWFLYQNSGSSSGQLQQLYGDESSIISQGSQLGIALLDIQTTSSTVYIYVTKHYEGIGTVADITAFNIKLRCYVFAEEVKMTV